MKAKTIKSILRRKVDSWLETIDDKDTRKLVAENVIVTGGSIASMLVNESVNDYDIYLRSSESVYAVADYYLKKFLEKPPTKFKKGGELEVFLADGYGKKVESFEQWKESGGSSRLRIVVQSAGIASEDGADDYQYFESADIDDAGEFVEQAADAVEKKEDGKREYRPVFITSNAITLSDDIQVVLRFFGEPEEIHKNYDYVHCTNYWCSWDGSLTLHPEALECIINKELRYSGSKYPVCSIFRVRKFLDRGWRINAGQLLKAMLQISELDLQDIAVLEDQMIGVDAAYFKEVVELCKKRMDETGADRVDHAYLVEIIDRLF